MNLGVMNSVLQTVRVFFAWHIYHLYFFLISQSDDRLGHLKLTRQGLRKRNRMVFNAARRAGARIVVTMGGGCGLLRSRRA